MRFGARHFSPPLWGWLLFIVIALIMLMLGRWQLDRAAEKIRMGLAADAARQAPALAITEISDPESAADVYTRVKIAGHWLAESQFLWDNRTFKGRAGFEIITPMRTSGGELVLINRGWLPLGVSRSDLPDVSIPPEFIDSVQVVTGYLSQPSKGFASGEASRRDAEWPKLLQYFDYSLIEELLAEPVFAGVVQVQELGGPAGDLGAGGVGEGVTGDGGADQSVLWFTGNWEADASGPAKHYSYAFQWFAMALALSVIFVLVNLKRVN